MMNNQTSPMWKMENHLLVLEHTDGVFAEIEFNANFEWEVFLMDKYATVEERATFTDLPEAMAKASAWVNR